VGRLFADFLDSRSGEAAPVAIIRMFGPFFYTFYLDMIT
jgi:hypothetical protein